MTSGLPAGAWRSVETADTMAREIIQPIWAVIIVHPLMLDETLEHGWEPYAIDSDGNHVLRRQTGRYATRTL